MQVVRLKVVTFIRLFLQRNPSERVSAHDAAGSDLFKELHYMRQEHRETEAESQLLIINRRPLKRAEKEEEKAEDAKPEEPRSGWMQTDSIKRSEKLTCKRRLIV